MNFKDLIIVGVALAMDAVGVSISIGVNSAIKRINKIGFIISFAFGPGKVSVIIFGKSVLNIIKSSLNRVAPYMTRCMNVFYGHAKGHL